MITEQQQEQATFYVLGTLTTPEQRGFEADLRASTELAQLVRSLQRTTNLVAMASPAVSLPPGLWSKVERRIEAAESEAARASAPARPTPPGLYFREADERGWKELPVRGAWIKLLSVDRQRGYAVLMGRLEPGVRYPAHVNVSAEDLYILTGDLHIGDRRLGPGDFHRADAGSKHEVNYSEEGCTLLAVLAADHPLVQVAMG